MPNWNRFTRGISSSFSFLANPLARFFRYQLKPFHTPARLDKGRVFVLPGIESYSFLNRGVVWGLIDAGVDQSVEVHDWTTGRHLLLLYHLCSWRRNLRQAELLAEKIVQYQDEYPGRPVTLIGHSGGGALALLTVNALPERRQVDRVILLGTAISPGFSLNTVLERTEVWNFSSVGDFFFLGLGTLMMGTIDRKHRIAAGAIGFRPPADLSPTDAENYRMRLNERPYRFRMAGRFHFGGHFGCVNRVFAAEELAPLIPPSWSSNAADLVHS